MSSPLVVLVTGQPASGKTTLARLLAGHLSLPIVSRDAITEALADTIGRPSRDLVQPSFTVFWRLLTEQVDASVGAVGEINLHRGTSEPAVQLMAARADVRLVFCMTSRKSAFVDSSSVSSAESATGALTMVGASIVYEPTNLTLPGTVAQPLSVDLPTIVVDTSAGYMPGLDAIVAAIRAPAEPPPS